MPDTRKNEEIALIDKLEPALSGKDPRQRLSLFFCVSLISLFAMGCAVGYNFGLAETEPQPLLIHILLFLAALVCAAIAALGAIRFMQTFKQILISSDSKEESQKARRAAHPKKAAPQLQAQQPGQHTRKA